MTLPMILRPEAEADIHATHADLERSRAGTGRKFLMRVREVLERIETMPQMYAIVWQDIRAARTKSFPHVIYYVAFPDRIEVIAVMHGSRGASAWKSRR